MVASNPSMDRFSMEYAAVKLDISLQEFLPCLSRPKFDLNSTSWTYVLRFRIRPNIL